MRQTYSAPNTAHLGEATAAFNADGFVVVPDLVDLETLDRLAPAVSEAVAQRTSPDQRTLDEKSRYEQSFLQCINLWEDFPLVRPLTFHPAIAHTAARLLGADGVRLWHDQALFKEPGGRGTDPHQDQPYWPIAEPHTITAWVPLDGVVRATGCMGYVPGSHRAGIRRFVNIFFGEPEDILADPAVADRSPEFVEVPRGAVAFHHGLTVHLAEPNATRQMRRVHTMIYVADGCTRTTAGNHPSVDRPGIEPGAVITSPVTPMAWPRSDGDLPPAPGPEYDSQMRAVR